MSNRDVITVIRDPDHVLGKQFSFNEKTKQVEKNSAVSLACGTAVQRHVPDVKSLERLLSEVAEDSNAAICNSCFPLIPIDEPFLILSERLFRER